MTPEELKRKCRAHRELDMTNVSRATFRKFVSYLKNKVPDHFDGVAERTVFLKFDMTVAQHPDEIDQAFKENQEGANIIMEVIHNMINSITNFNSTKQKRHGSK